MLTRAMTWAVSFSVEFRVSSFAYKPSLGNVKIILNNPYLLRAFYFCLAKMCTST